MEPMNLGSPQSSPSSPSPVYLPAFLMGESQQPLSPTNTSPGRNKSVLKMQTYSMTPTNIKQKSFNPEFSTPGSFNGSVVEKSGPPKQALFDTIDSKSKTPISNSTMQNFMEEPQFAPNESFSRIGMDSLNYSCNLNESSRTPFQTSVNLRVDNIDTLWVTVFGFIPNTTSLVLTHLAGCGQIIEKKFPTQGNWVHLKFNSPHEVARALLLNGKLISNCIMVGVVPYYNKQEMNKENLNASGLTSPIRVRSLRNSFVVPQSPSNVVSPQNVPQKSTGMVTKAMEYVFGW